MRKLIFKAAKNTMGDFVLINPDEYIEIGFVNKPDVKNWKNEINKEEFENGKYGTLLGCGEYKDIQLWLKTYSNFTPVD